MWNISKLMMLLIIFYTVVACREAPEEKSEDSVHLVVAPVQNIQLVPVVRSSGRLASEIEFRLSFKTGGIIDEIFIEEGQKVNEGQALAKLELSEIKSRVNQAKLAVNKAERDFQRAKNLFQDSVVTLELFQNATTALEVARSDLKIAEFNLDHSIITAPSEGIILKKLAEENEIVGPGQPVLYYASTENEWIMRVNVTDKDRVNLKLADSASLMFDAFPDQKIRAEISEISEMADPFSGTFEVELTLLDQVQNPVTGLIGTALIYPSQQTVLPIIPYEALVEGDGMSGQVWLIQNQSPQKHWIQIHTLHDRGILVRSGLTAGDTVVIKGGQYIRDDSRIIIETDYQQTLIP